LMNGLGIAGKLSGVTKTLQKCKTLIKSNGQILVDSSDISYLYEDGNILKPQGYYGDLQYRYEYRGNKGDWFDWVYVDSATLHEEVKKVGMNMEVLTTDENDQYLALITL
ncbi:MAG: SAM-dependent methyltransferase, partial [Marinoscillum sp.]